MRIFEEIIDERLKDPKNVKDDVLGTLLKLVESNELSLDEVKHLLVDIRHKKVKELVEYVQQCCDNGLSVDIGKTGFITSLNLLSNTFFSMDLASHTSSKSQQFKDLVWLLLEAKSNKLPPGPTPWPIIGNILKLGDKPHHVVAELSKIYGPIMTLKLGSITTVVISSPEVAQEMFLKHDLDFSGRAITDAMRATNHDQVSMVFLPISPKWRNLRKIATIHLFSSHQLDASQDLRLKKVNELVEYARQCSESGLPIDVGRPLLLPR
uniref:Uncharacterized protein n=1 Tax=Chenopodium quinoa TaxID=63459 RepID=A0A803NEZ2_CHEQI